MADVAIRIDPLLDAPVYSEGGATPSLSDYAASARYALQFGSTIALGGMSVPTDANTQSQVTAAYARATNDASFVVSSWKVAPGVYVTLTAVQIVAIADALTTFIQTLFDRERAIDEGIVAGTITTTAQVDAALAGVT